MKKYEFCSKCGGENTGSHASYCKPCYNQWKRARYQKNREKEVARVMDYNYRNYDKFKERLSEYRKKDSWKETRKAWIENNKDKIAIYDHNKKSKRRSQLDLYKPISKEDWNSVLVKFKHKCAYCGGKSSVLQIDHVEPLSRGGSHTLDNLVPACGPCNNSKNSRDVIDFMQSRGKLL